MKKFNIITKFVRRIPDPLIEHAERHILIASATELPDGLPYDPNPRRPRIDRSVWREVRKHLFNREGTPNTFHLKNKGITLIAAKVRKTDGENVELTFEEGQGIVDGGHTYALLQESCKEILELNANLEDGQSPIVPYIKLEVLTGYPSDLWPEIAGGLNTAVQVQEMSLMELQNEFDWIKAEIAGQPYADQIAFREGEKAPYDARDVIVLLDAFNIFDFPNDGSDQPVRAYTSKAQVLAAYKAREAQYARLRPLLKGILTLHDIIAAGGKDKYNETGGKGGKLAFVEAHAGNRFYEFPFAGLQSKYRIMGGALLPMLAAFRWMVEVNGDGLATWRGGFGAVKAMWDKTGPELMRSTQETSIELGRKPHAVGRSRNHWATLHKTVANADLQERALRS